MEIFSTTASPTIVHEDTWLVRIDHKLNATTTLVRTRHSATSAL